MNKASHNEVCDGIKDFVAQQLQKGTGIQHLTKLLIRKRKVYQTVWRNYNKVILVFYQIYRKILLRFQTADNLFLS